MKQIKLVEIDGIEKTGRSIITSQEKLETLDIDLKKCIKHHTAKFTVIPFDVKKYSELSMLLTPYIVKDKFDLVCILRNVPNDADLNHLDVSNVTNMSCLFEDSKFNGNISQWDVSNVTNMSYMFRGSKFTGDISNWNVSNVIDMRYMFHESYCKIDINNWNPVNLKHKFNIFAQSPLARKKPTWYRK